MGNRLMWCITAENTRQLDTSKGMAGGVARAALGRGGAARRTSGERRALLRLKEEEGANAVEHDGDEDLWEG